jgi:NADH-quinone oxidoreductase subunit L
LAGFWSKDEILASFDYAGGNYATAQGGGDLGTIVLWIAIAGAFVTAFYMTRVVWLTFFGEYKGDAHPHESPKIMTYPLIGLAVGAALFGFINMPGITHIFTDLVGGRAFEGFHELEHHAESLNLGLAAVGTAAAVLGIVLGLRIWGRDRETQAARDSFRIPLLYPLLENKYFIDDLYMDGVIRPIRGPLARAINWTNGYVIDFVVNGAGLLARSFGKVVYWFDQRGVDGAINASGAVTGAGGGMLRLLQTGKVQQYAILIFAATVIMVAGLVIWF